MVPISPIYYLILRTLSPFPHTQHAFVADLGLPGGFRACCPPRVIVFLGLLCSHLAWVLPVTSIMFRLSKQEAKHLSHDASWIQFIPAIEKIEKESESSGFLQGSHQ